MIYYMAERKLKELFVRNQKDFTIASDYIKNKNTRHLLSI
ncbi:MAG: hypothetical protein JWM09_1259 [Francisellaceae bacterium]|nr:hypothetical protein [Francisellaceae bacterium]